MNSSLFFIAFSDLRSNKKRTLLSVLAIAIGVVSLLVLTSISLGINKDITSKLKGFGSDIILIVPTKVENAAITSASAGLLALKGKFYETDAKKLKSIEGVKLTSYALQGRSSVYYKNQTKSISVFAVQPVAYLAFSKDLSIKKGRWLTNSYEAVLGGKVQDYFDKPPDVGKSIIIGNHSYKVVGILEETGNSISQLDNVIVIPYFAGRELYSNRFAEKEVSAILLQVADGYKTKDVSEKVDAYLMKIKKITKEEDKFYSIVTKDFIENSISQITSMLDLFFVSISIISLFVGLIGIANSIYMSIMEKTREIGTLRAIGMKKDEILSIYVFEGAILGIVGFIFGLVVSLPLIFIGKNFIPMEINPFFLILSFFVSLVGAVVASYFPSKKASNIEPAEALVYE